MRKLKSISLSGMVAAAAFTLGLSMAPQTASAQPQTIGEIFPVGFNFCPRTTAKLDGQLLAISSNSALFSLLGTIYGGDGRTTFALPDMRGRTTFAPGTGPGLSNYRLGEKGGATQRTILASQLPAHKHNMAAVNKDGDKGGPASDFPAIPLSGDNIYHNGPADILMDPGVMQYTGGGQPLSMIEPFTAVNWCIVMFGIYPSRS